MPSTLLYQHPQQVLSHLPPVDHFGKCGPAWTTRSRTLLSQQARFGIDTVEDCSTIFTHNSNFLKSTSVARQTSRSPDSLCYSDGQNDKTGQPVTRKVAMIDTQTLANGNPAKIQSVTSLHNAAISPPYPTPVSSAVPSNRQEPFYESYYSAKHRRSPADRRSAHTNDVKKGVPLSIPPSINNSNGSLPEFAAQITCLFWFESTSQLARIEENQLPSLISPLVPEAIPTTGFRIWVNSILSMTRVSQNVIILALLFIYRLKHLNPSVKGKVGSEFRLLTVALMLGNKFLDDSTYTNKTWADVSGIVVQEIHLMEVEFLSNMKYNLYASESDFNAWQEKLGRFASYYDRAMLIPTAGASVAPAPEIASNSLAPRSQHISLPSPPNSHQSSPPSVQQLPGQCGMATTRISIATSHDGIMPHDGASHSWSRKRSLDDTSSDPPSKRHSVSTSSSRVNSSQTSETETVGWWLPPPGSFSSTTPSSQESRHHSLDGQIGSICHPLPGQLGPMSGIATPSHLPTIGAAGKLALPRPQPGRQAAPTLSQLTTSHLPNSVDISPSRESYARHQQYAHFANSPSPTSTRQPAAYRTPQNLSPMSSMPVTTPGLGASNTVPYRHSPYKPIRGVKTLLVAPHSSMTNIQHAPQQVSHDQMRHQPLGRPISERRRGVLPCHSFDTFNDARYPHCLPPPANMPAIVGGTALSGQSGRV